MMKKRMIVTKYLGLVCMTGALLTGCGSSFTASDSGKSYMSAPQENASYAEEAYSEDWGYEVDTVAEPEEYEDMPDGVTVGENSVLATTDRKLIRNISMNVETKEFDTALDAVKKETNSMNGYIERMELDNGSQYAGYRYARSASFTLRIPKDKTDAFLEKVSSISNVVSQNESVDDVTLTYTDMESHKAVLKAEHERLMEFMEQAETVEDMLEIERRLSDIQYETESLEAQLRTYDNKVDYSTVYLYVQEVKELTPVVEEDPSFGQRISQGFVESAKDVFNGLKELVIWFIVNIPYFLFALAVLGGFFLILRGIVRHGRKKSRDKKQTAEVSKEQEQQKEQEK